MVDFLHYFWDDAKITRNITEATNLLSYIQVKYRGSSARVHQLSLAELLPATPDYVTYEVV